MKEGGEKTGHAHEPTERETIEKTKPNSIRFPQNGRDCFPFGWFTTSRAVFRQQSEENQHNNYGKHSHSESIRPTKFLSEARREERRDERPRIPRTSNAHDEPLILWRIPASRNRQSYGKTCATNAQQEPKKIKVCGRVCETPGKNQRKQSESEPEQAGPAFAKTLAEKSEYRPEQRSTKKRDCCQQPFLVRRELEHFGEEWSKGTEQDPYHEADIEIEKRRDERWEVAAFHELAFFHLISLRGTEFLPSRPTSCLDSGSWAPAYAPILWSDLRPLDTHGALLVIGLARNRIEGTLRHLIGICLGVVKGHEDLTRRDDLRNAKLDAFHAPPSRNHVDVVMRLQSERLRVPWIHLQPRVWREPFEDRNVSCFRARMPMLDGAACIQHERKVRVRLLRKGFPLDREKPRFSILRRESTVGVEPRRLYFRGAGRIRPLNPAVALDKLVCEPGVIAEAARRNPLPLFEGILRLGPSRKKLAVAAELFCQTQKDVEVGAGLSRRFHSAIDLAHAAFRIRIGAFFFAPDSRREDKVRDFGRRRRMKSILNYQKIQAIEAVLQYAEIRERHDWICCDDPQSANLLRNRSFDNVRVRPSARSRQALRGDTPERRQFLAVGCTLKFAIPREARREARLPCSHRIALPSNRKRRRSRPADVAGDQRKIIDDVYGFRALGSVVHTHRPANERGFGFAVDECSLVDLLGRKPGELRDVVRRVLANRLFQLVETRGMRRNVLAIDETVLDEQMNHAVQKSDIRAWLQRQVEVCHHRGLCHAGIGHD